MGCCAFPRTHVVRSTWRKVAPRHNGSATVHAVNFSPWNSSTHTPLRVTRMRRPEFWRPACAPRCRRGAVWPFARAGSTSPHLTCGRLKAPPPEGIARSQNWHPFRRQLVQYCCGWRFRRLARLGHGPCGRLSQMAGGRSQQVRAGCGRPKAAHTFPHPARDPERHECKGDSTWLVPSLQSSASIPASKVTG